MDEDNWTSKGLAEAESLLFSILNLALEDIEIGFAIDALMLLENVLLLVDNCTILCGFRPGYRCIAILLSLHLSNIIRLKS